MEATRIDWRKPVAAHAEETYWVEPAEDGTQGQPRRSIRWHLSEEGYGRVRRMEACHQCLTGFPAQPRKGTWRIWKTSGFGFLHSLEDSRKLIEAGRCPICKSEISPEMLELQLDPSWAEEDAKLKQAKYDSLDDARERDTHYDEMLIERLGLRDPVAPPSRRKSMKRRGES